MSIKLMSHVWDAAQVSGSELLVLLALADFANDEGGSIYPSMATIAKKARLSDKQARRVVHKLIDDGILSLVEQGGWQGTRNRPNEYCINLDAIGVLPSREYGTPKRDRGGTPADVSTVLPPMGDDPSVNHHIDPPGKVEGATPPATDPDVARVWEAWTANMPGMVTPVIKDSVNELLNEYSAAEVVEAIAIACRKNKRYLDYIKGILAKGAFGERPTVTGGDYRTTNNGLAAAQAYAEMKGYTVNGRN